ncbi:PAS domain-containing protein [Paracoccus sp. (in: a-proteobacteria)]|uniref:PAS domain-containing protein n=1 Tax=Paracoccus sp. TaxID=267 RepID=UPI00272D35C4|nr:PAS domain-containing protein [Paracoccus sp. (in: a-proteobacteria)]
MSDHETGPDEPPVIRLSDHGVAQGDSVLREMRRYWTLLRGGRAVPARSDVDPRGFSRSIDHAFILERIAPGAARIRLAGRHLIDLMGMEVRGMPICAFLNPSSRGRLSDVLESVFKAPQIAELRLASPAGYARPALTGRMLLMPLRSDLGDVTRALGCLVTEGETGVAPRRFDLVSDHVMPVIEGGVTLAPSPSVSGFAETGDGFRPRVDPRPARPPERPLAVDLPPSTPEERRARFQVVQGSKPPQARDG